MVDWGDFGIYAGTLAGMYAGVKLAFNAGIAYTGLGLGYALLMSAAGAAGGHIAGHGLEKIINSNKPAHAH